jgi:hypothetical protein
LLIEVLLVAMDSAWPEGGLTICTLQCA